MSIKDNFPSLGPSLSLNFARSKTLDPRITFSRPSTSGDATYTDGNGLIVTAAADEPRFDHKYENGVVKSLGLLVEEQRINVLLYSEEFDSWSKNNSSVTSNATTAPDGTTTADKLVENSSTGNKEVYQNATFTSGTSLTFSCFAKAGERTRFRLAGTTERFDSSTNAYFDLSAGTVVTTTGGFTSASIEAYPNGWYRCVGTMLPTSSGTNNVFITLVNTGTTTGYTGDGSSGIFLWGAQLEVGAFPTSYIPTSGSQATRSKDSVSMTGTNFSDWYNPSEGTIHCSFRAQSSETKYLMGISNNSAAELIYIRATSTGSDSAMRDGGSDVAYKPIAYSRDIDTLSKHCVSYKQDDFIVSAQGQISTVDDGCTVPTPTNISIGSLYNTTQLGGTISQLTYYPKRLTNTQLQNLTK